MSARLVAASGLLALLALLGGVLGCLRAFGPDLRARGVHAGVSSEPSAQEQAGACMGCHEAEADALARMEAAKLGPAPHAPHAHAHDGGELHSHAEPPPPAPMPGSMTGPPLVADWMVADTRACTDCHRIRP